MNERPIIGPPANSEGSELLRAWVADHRLSFSIKSLFTAGSSPADTLWGVVLAGAAQHIAEQIAKDGSKERQAALDEICRSFVFQLTKNH